MAHKIKLPIRKKNRKSIEMNLHKYGLEIGHAKQALLQACAVAEKMSDRGYRLLQNVYRSQDENVVDKFNNTPILLKWFGKAEKSGDVKDVYSRISSVLSRIKKGLTVRLDPQDGRPEHAKNMAGFLDAKGFRVFPSLFEGFADRTNDKDVRFIASVFIHEMIHLWFGDQKLNNAKVYEEQQAIDLACINPQKARKSAENYERFCRELYIA